MDDKMRFYPDQLEFQAGQAVRLMVHNAGRVPHELVLGTAEQIQAHAQQMKQSPAHDHRHEAGGAAAIQVEPGQTGELVLRFHQPGRLEMACLIPGHYEAGTRPFDRSAGFSLLCGPARRQVRWTRPQHAQALKQQKCLP